MRNLSKKIILCLITVISLAMTPLALAGEILKDVNIKGEGDIVEITAKMGMPFKYIKHFPSRRGKIIQIQIKPADDNVDSKKLKRRDTIKSPQSDLMKIRDVIYEGNVRGGPYLVLRFPEVVSFSIKPTPVSDEITILIKTEKQRVVAAEPVKKDKPEDNMDQLMREARIALTNGKNSDAILLFSEVLQQNNPKYMPDAREYLGLARERSGQLELAKKDYEEYLTLYPKNKRATTVKQRLMTLNARLDKRPKRELKEGKRVVQQNQDKFKRTDVFGRVSSIYYSAFIEKPEATSEKDKGIKNQQSLLMNFLDLSRRQRDKDKEIRYVFSGSHEADLTTADYHMEGRLRAFYIDYENKVNGLEVSAGRQSVNTGGVLGRFDGGLLGFRIKPKIKGYLVGGFPVDFIDHQSVQINKPMYGGRIDFNEVKKHWKGSVYAINQDYLLNKDLDKIVNRRAIGAEARYFHNKKIFYSLVDYDIYFGDFNFLTLHYGWQINEKTKLDIHVDNRRSPVLLSTNALLGLSSVSNTKTLGDGVDPTALEAIKNSRELDDLIKYGMTADDIRRRVKSKTGHSTLITTGFRRALKKDLDINATLTLSRYKQGVEPEEDDDEGEPPKDTSFLPTEADFDVALNMQVVKRNFFKDRDILLGGARITNNDSSRRYELNGNLRFPVNKKLWINPKLRLMYTTNKLENKSSQRISPKVHAEYKFTKKLSIDGEAGLDVNMSQLEGEDYNWLSINAGIRYIF